MNLTIHPTSKITGELRMPGDKSLSHRAAMLSSLAEGETYIDGYLAAEDCLSTLSCLQQLGVDIHRDGTSVKIRGEGLWSYNAPAVVLQVGNSGTTMRLMMGILAAQKFEATLDGDDSIRQRPMDRVVKPLNAMGAAITGRTERCLAPIKVMGNELHPIRYLMPVASAQVKSAVLLAGLHAEGETSVVEPTASRDHTERMLRYFGAEVLQKANSVLVRGPARLRGRQLRIPGDVSSAAFFVTAAASLPGSELVVRDVLLNPSRAAYLNVLKQMGASISTASLRVRHGEPVGDVIVRGSRLHGVTIEGGLIPLVIDELPILAVAASIAEGETIIKDAKELRVKESDRIKTMTTELNRLGAKVQETEEGMIIEGVSHLRGAECDSYGDHRVAMSLAIAGLVARGETTIHQSDCIATSFPEFEGMLQQVIAPSSAISPKIHVVM